MKQSLWNRMGRILPLVAVLCGVNQFMAATDAAEPIKVFSPVGGKLPPEQFNLVIRKEEPEAQQPPEFDFTEVHNDIPSIKLTALAGERVSLDGSTFIPLKPDQRYALRVLVKFSELIPVKGEKSGASPFFVIYLQSAKKVYHAARIGSSLSSSGWIKVFIPFDSSQPDFDKVKVNFRLFNLQGSVWICDPLIVEVPDNFPQERFFELPSGEKVSPLVLHYQSQP